MSASVFNSCERHNPYDTQAAAKAALAVLRAARGRSKTRGLKAYKCPSGKHWHLGRDKRFRE